MTDRSAVLPVVALHGVGKTFGNGVVALDGLDLAVRPGEFLTLLGPSGCGKSTALRIIAGLSEPTRGEMEWSEAAEGAARQIGFVFQEPTLMPWATVAANVRLPLRVGGTSAEARARVAAAVGGGGL
jgi:NitT/TauT family transport system ATP-binding protein